MSLLLLSSPLPSTLLEDSSPSSLALEGFSESSVLGFEFVGSDAMTFALASEIQFFFSFTLIFSGNKQRLFI